VIVSGLLKKPLAKIFLVLCAAFFLAATLGGGLVYWYVAVAPGEEVRQENIQRILGRESPVFYRDGVNKVGVFFEEAHRQYVSYEQIPPAFVQALVAAEDRTFFTHRGIDYLAVFRALAANIKAGRVVQGGSTLSQQTAKNLFKRKDRSLAAKLKELLHAWRLEYHYPKEKILEFYANQFYVSGNGHGLGVAARYYFDKQVADLDLLECAFIAGSVKRPNHYNPFFRRDDDGARAARERAQARAGYVLGQMRGLKMISEEEYRLHLSTPIPFRQGRMSFALNTILDLVRDGLADPEVEEALALHGIDNVATSGIRIHTTVEKELQESALYALRRELSRLDVRLRGYERQSLQELYGGMPPSVEGSGAIGRHDFLLGRVVSLDPNKVVVSVLLDERKELQGRIDRQGILPLVNSLVRYEQNPWAEASPADVRRFLQTMQEGDLVYVSVRAHDGESGDLLLDLEKYPLLQGALLAMQEGTIRAMVGGMDNTFYNRAVTARRPMGSAIKPLLYLAALQLGWNNLDLLHNGRNVFVYQNMPYFPRPDHDSPHSVVSMSWAGVTSENLASVWLLSRLCDRLAPAQFAELTAQLDLGQRQGEFYQQYVARIRDQHGVLVNRGALLRAAFESAVEQMEPDLLFAGREKEQEALRLLHYGSDFARFLAENGGELRRAIQAGDHRAAQEARLRQNILKNNFLRYQELWRSLRSLADGAQGTEEAWRHLYYDAAAQRYVYAEENIAPHWERVSRPHLAAAFMAGGQGERQRFWDDVLLEGVFSASTVALTVEAVDREYERLAALPAYSGEVLRQVRDFRVLAGLTYLSGLCRELGIESKLDPVLSFPLGSNVISLFELTRAYEAMQTGRVFSRGRQGAGAGLSIIARIEDAEGVLIYEPREAARVVIEPEQVLGVSDILRNVVRFGTARQAERAIRLESREAGKEETMLARDLLVPVFGKTGTANRYTNAVFAGFVPGVAEAGYLVPEKGYALAAYVGFDDNAPMERRATRLSGASAALPVWITMANAVLREQEYTRRLDLADIAFQGKSEAPLFYPELGQITVAVDEGLGGVPGRGGSAFVITFAEDGDAGESPRLARLFRPYWRTAQK